MKYVCNTLFDITATGITGHYKTSRIPFTDEAGQEIANSDDWNRARNQQRNWETLVQLISMRTQIFELTTPVAEDKEWSFEFEVETPGIYGSDDNPVHILISDADGIPMINHLNNKPEIAPMLVIDGPNQNIWFSPLSVNT
jgi:hypothetical protein